MPVGWWYCFCRHSTVDPAAAAGSPPYPSHSDCLSMNTASVNNIALYNVKTLQTTNYDSSNDINLLLAPGGCTDRSRWPSKHASLEGAYKRGTRTSSGMAAVRLDRNLSSGCLECHEMFADSVLPVGPSSLSAFPDLADEEEPSAFQTRPKSKACNKSSTTASSSALSTSSKDVFSSCPCAANEQCSRRSCDMKEHCHCYPHTLDRECCGCSGHETGRCRRHCSRCLRMENPSNMCSSRHHCSSSQTPKTKRLHVSPLNPKQHHYSSRDASSSAFLGDNKAVALNSHRDSNHQKLSNTSQAIENLGVCSSRHHSTNSGSNMALIRSCSVSYDRTTSKRDNIPVAGSGFSKLAIPSNREVTVNRESSHHARSQSVHVASDFNCTDLSMPTPVCVCPKLQGPSAS